MSNELSKMHVEKLSWALSLMQGARRIVEADPATSIQIIGLPFYLLIGFSIENALKAYLEFRSVTGTLHRSHDLTKLLEASLYAGLVVPEEVSHFIRELRNDHANFAFRYPEKAGWVSLFKAEPALNYATTLIETVTRSFPPEDIFGWSPDPADFLLGRVAGPSD